MGETRISYIALYNKSLKQLNYHSTALFSTVSRLLMSSAITSEAAVILSWPGICGGKDGPGSLWGCGVGGWYPGNSIPGADSGEKSSSYNTSDTSVVSPSYKVQKCPLISIIIITFIIFYNII